MTPGLFSFISALTALFATIIGPYVTLKTAKSQINANVISLNRAKWIDNMRDLLARAISHWTAIQYLRADLKLRDSTEIATHPALLSEIEQAVMTKIKIRLMLKPTDPDAQRLIQTFESAITCLHFENDQATVEQKITAYSEEIIAIGQSILNREWTRVKSGT
jgi:hypothetical protein